MCRSLSNMKLGFMEFLMMTFTTSNRDRRRLESSYSSSGGSSRRMRTGNTFDENIIVEIMRDVV